MANVTTITLIGQLPPPVGGVTVHNQRLMHKFKEANFKCECVHPRSGFISFIRSVIFSQYVYVSVNNRILMLLLIIFLRITLKKHSICFHGNVNKILGIQKLFQVLTMKLARKILVLNKESLNYANSVSTQEVLQVTAYVEHDTNRVLDHELVNKFSKLARKFRCTVCTNAFSKRYTQDGTEIYGISELINYFERVPDVLLIISNPDGRYAKDYYSSRSTSSNILFISEEHDFLDVLEVADVFIRNTSTDGDSLSVHEALAKGIVTYATDVVQRPRGVITYGSLEQIDSNVFNARVDVEKRVAVSSEKSVFEFIIGELNRLK